MEGHTDEVWSVDWDLACKTAVSGSDDKTIKQWDLGTGECVETYQCGTAATQVIMHQSGTSFLSCQSGLNTEGEGIVGEITAWAVGCGTPLITTPLVGLSRYYLAASPDLSSVALCAKSQAAFDVKVWK